VADIRAHAGSIERITKYNGVVGKIRSLWSRFSARGGHNPYKPGSVGFHAFEEVRKINEIIELRRSAWNLHDLDPRILGEEIEFLEGRRSFFEEVLRSGEETGTLSESASKEFGSPDTGIVTSMALSHGYELPDGRQGAARDWYYYRHNADRPTEFELVRKPEAPAEAPALRAKVVDGKFAGFEMGETPKESKSYDQSWSPKRVATDMLTEGALVPYVAMLEKMKIKAGSRESVMKRIEQLVEERQTKNPKQPYKADQLRGKVKEDFKDEVTTHLKGASYERMQELINPLDNGDRGHLAEQWYRLNYAPDAKSQVQVGKVATDKGTPRTIDLLDGKVMIEIKDVQGSIDHDQFEAYLGLLTTGEFGPKEGPTKVSALKYVFIDPAGALANLGWIRDNAKGVRGITIEFFDYNGEKQTTTPSKIDKAIEMLQGQRAKIAKKPQ